MAATGVNLPARRRIIAANLNYWRWRRGYTQRDLAALAYTSQRTISSLERCEVSISPPTLTKLADALGVAASDLTEASRKL